MSFAEQIRPHVAKVGGATPAGEICGMSRQIVNAWLRGDVEPSKATQAGAVLLLRRATTKKPRRPSNGESSYRSGPVSASNKPAAQSAHSD